MSRQGRRTARRALSPSRNKFLANIRDTDAIAHAVRCFEDENVIHVSNNVDHKHDIEIITLELISPTSTAARRNFLLYDDPFSQKDFSIQ